MTLHELKQVKKVQLEIMDELHRICEKHAITYYLNAGSVLGAVRHNGFIPWDIDIDVAMFRDEYDRFKEVCKSELSERYRYCDYTNVHNFMRPHALLCDTKSKVHMKYDHLNPISEDHGIYVDIFPLDNAPDNEKRRKRQAAKMIRVRKFKKWRLPYSYSLKKWKRIAHYAVSAMLSWVSVDRINDYQQSVMQQYRDRSTQCVCSMASQYPYSKQCMPRQIYGEPTLLPFEGRTYYAPEHYEEYLSRLYGDYMQLPPEEKRRANLEVYSKIEFL